MTCEKENVGHFDALFIVYEKENIDHFNILFIVYEKENTVHCDIFHKSNFFQI